VGVPPTAARAALDSPGSALRRASHVKIDTRHEPGARTALAQASTTAVGPVRAAHATRAQATPIVDRGLWRGLLSAGLIYAAVFVVWRVIP